MVCGLPGAGIELQLASWLDVNLNTEFWDVGRVAAWHGHTPFIRRRAPHFQREQSTPLLAQVVKRKQGWPITRGSARGLRGEQRKHRHVDYTWHGKLLHNIAPTAVHKLTSSKLMIDKCSWRIFEQPTSPKNIYDVVKFRQRHHVRSHG